MDNNTLASNIIESLAWPATALIVLALFRKEPSSLFGRIRKGQLGDASVEFEVAVAAVEEIVQAKSGARKAAHSPARIEDQQRAEDDPRGSVIKAWLEIDREARGALQRKGVLDVSGVNRPIDKHIKELAKLSDNLSDQDLMMFRELRTIRNKSVHDHDFRPSPESVLAYMTLAKNLSETFKTID